MVIATDNWDDFINAAKRLHPPVATVYISTVEEGTTKRYYLVASVGDLSAPWVVYSGLLTEVSKNATNLEEVEKGVQKKKEEAYRALKEELTGTLVFSGTYTQ